MKRGETLARAILAVAFATAVPLAAEPVAPGHAWGENAGWIELAEIIRARKPGMPIGAIAGINESNVADVIAAGADGVAAISAICMARNVEDKTRVLRQLIEYERRLRS